MTERGDWTTMETNNSIIEWSVQPDQGMVQGPLDLNFLAGQRISLSLQPGQIAMLIHDEHLQAVYMDGVHLMAVGEGKGDVPRDGHLVFLDVSEGLQVAWTNGQPAPLDGTAGIIGNCTLAIAAPGRFYETFLAGTSEWDEDFIRRLVRQASSAALERALTNTDPDAMHLQTRLANLAPADLDEELAPLGLSCTRTALYTAAPPVENLAPELAPDVTGQFEGVRHT